jgi:hypothetical protein
MPWTPILKRPKGLDALPYVLAGADTAPSHADIRDCLVRAPNAVHNKGYGL